MIATERELAAELDYLRRARKQYTPDPREISGVQEKLAGARAQIAELRVSLFRPDSACWLG